MIALDHLAVACTTLDEGRAAVEAALGVPLQTGGQHAAFGTHNLLLGLNDLYLEVIAIDPDARAPDRPRWFDLDRFRGLPRVTNWICRTDDMAAALAASPPGTGTPVALERGDLRWQMAVPDDGILPHGNLFPALIQWQGTAHPAPRLDPRGCTLDRLVIETPDPALEPALAPLLADPRVVIEPGDRRALHAAIRTPGGLRWL
ncbi:VOC family protein [Pseudaestuariivita atlantica]|uniref:Polyphosphate kinase n=1 Tax=Pseudaestuariivita atlantica TaxID=1317121 RepID=A0A0L1JRR4_9RHOB|nr:VOC family protein [Pseudaestuariivita atlantica]KNG94098.1 polyphosphate kinase [Pseudaestuariivita atlantica]